MKKTNINVTLVFIGDQEFITEEVTQDLHITATKTCRMGDLIRVSSSGKKIFYKESSWECSLGRVETLDMGKQLKDIENIFSDKITEILLLKEKYKLYIKFEIVVIIKNNETPSIFIDKDSIDFAQKLRAEFDIDMYVE